MRAKADEAELFFYIYVTNEEDHLDGVFSLRELVLAPPTTRVVAHHGNPGSQRKPAKTTRTIAPRRSPSMT